MTSFNNSNECHPPTFCMRGEIHAADTIVWLKAITILSRWLENWWCYFKPA